MNLIILSKVLNIVINNYHIKINIINQNINILEFAF